MKHGWRNTCKAIITAFVTLFLVCLLPSIGFSSYTYDGETKTSGVTAVETTEPVCYITESSSTTYFMTIEGALSYAGNTAHASSSETIYVIPEKTVTITKNCTIASGDTLSLPYEGDVGSEVINNGTTLSSGIGFGDKQTSYVTSYRKTLVYIDEGVTLTVYGTLTVGGVTGNTGTGLVGAVNGKYCEINMLANSKIDAKSGSNIYLYGYIKESAKNNNSMVELVSGANIQLPLVIYDYRGGQVTYQCTSNDCCPFKMFDFPNIQVIMKLNSGATVSSEYKIYAASQTFSDVITVVGSDSSNFICISSGYVTFKYTPQTLGVTVATSASDTTCTIISVYGNVSLGYISLTIAVSVPILGDVTVNINTSEYELPISYRLQFEVYSGTMTVGNPLKFMPGSIVRIHSGAEVDINDSVIALDETYTEEYASNIYPKLGTGYYAQVINNGTIDIGSSGSYGGMVYTESADAVFDAFEGSLSVKSTYDNKYNTTSISSSTLYTISTSSITLAAQGYINSYGSTANFSSSYYVSSKNDSDAGGYWKEDLSNYATMSVSVGSLAGSAITTTTSSATVTYTFQGVSGKTWTHSSTSASDTESIIADIGTTVSVSYTAHRKAIWGSGQTYGKITITDSSGNTIAEAGTSTAGNEVSLTFTATDGYVISMTSSTSATA